VDDGSSWGSLVGTLRAKAERVRWGPADRDERFALFSKRRFVDGLEERLDDSWSRFSVTDIDGLLTPDRVFQSPGQSQT
jgi:hypothetical protein